jgi:hypothetical protein
MLTLNLEVLGIIIERNPNEKIFINSTNYEGDILFIKDRVAKNKTIISFVLLIRGINHQDLFSEIVKAFWNSTKIQFLKFGIDPHLNCKEFEELIKKGQIV